MADTPIVPMFAICGTPYVTREAANAAAKAKAKRRGGRYAAKACPLGCGALHVFRHNPYARRRAHAARTALIGA